MQIDRLHIAIRERHIGQVFDIALQVCRVHWRALLCFYLVLAAPLALASWWFAHIFLQLYIDDFWFFAIVGLAAGSSLLAAPVTIYLGQSMFNEATPPWPALRGSIRLLPRLLLLGFVRGLAMFTVVGLLAFPRHWHEVQLLERPRGWGIGRAWRLWSFYFGENIGSWLIHLAAMIILYGSIAIGFMLLVGVLQFGALQPASELGVFDTRYLWPFLFLYGYVQFTAVVSFVAYLDLRTRREGWEVEIGLRRAAGRLQSGASQA